MRSRVLNVGSVLLVTASILVLISPATAAADDGWDWFLAPFYLWAVDLNGTQGFGNVTTDVDTKFEDLYPDIETNLTLYFEGVKNQRWGFILNLSYTDIESTQTVLNTEIKSGLTAPIYELDGFYRLGDGPHLFDLLFGLRYYDVENRVAFTGGVFDGLSFDKSFDWVDGVAGARWLWNFARKWHLSVRGDVAAGGSDLTLNGTALVHWQPWKVVGFLGGYRILDIDYKDGSGRDRIVYKIQQAGPVLALTFVW